MMNKKVPLQLPSPGIRFRFRFRFIRAGEEEGRSTPNISTKNQPEKGSMPMDRVKNKSTKQKAPTLWHVSREDAHARTCSMAVL